MGNLRYVRGEDRTKKTLKITYEAVDWNRIVLQVPMDRENLTDFGIHKRYEQFLLLD